MSEVHSNKFHQILPGPCTGKIIKVLGSNNHPIATIMIGEAK